MIDYKLEFSKIRKKIPVRTVFFIILLVFFVTGYFYSGASEKVNEISSLLLKILMFILASIVFFSFSTILFSYILCLKSRKTPEIKFQYTENDIICEIKCDKIYVPFAGNLTAELIFDKRYNTVIALKRKKGQTGGNKKLLLPDIKNYDLDTVTLFFQDFFRMFSLQKTFRIKSSISILPTNNRIYSLNNIPSSQYDDEIRTDTYHHREGELLQFKHFESSDDIRRIVWSVYARSKELIVRTVEMMSLYASQIDLHVSFNNKYADSLEPAISDRFLNYYKTTVWEIYLSLKANSEVRFIPDRKPEIEADYRFEVAAQISGMTWHTNRIDEYFTGSKVSICCISTLVSYRDVEKFTDILDENTVVIVVTLKSIAGKISAGNLLKKIFTISDEKEHWQWLVSNTKRQINNNEIRILETLKSKNVKYIEI